MAILIRHCETITQSVAPKNGHDFTLDEMQAFVGGHIEFVHLDDDMILCINEEGKLLELPPNRIATVYASPYLRDGDYIAGHAVLMTKTEAGD